MKVINLCANILFGDFFVVLDITVLTSWPVTGNISECFYWWKLEAVLVRFMNDTHRFYATSASAVMLFVVIVSGIWKKCSSLQTPSFRNHPNKVPATLKLKLYIYKSEIEAIMIKYV